MKKIEKSLTTPKKNLKGEPLVVFNIHSVGKYQKKLKGDPLVKFFFEKKSHRAENTLREYPLDPLSFLDDVKILRKLLKK